MVIVRQQTWLPRRRPLTRTDLDQLPEDGRRHELIDGVLVVSPAPSRLHQRVVRALLVLLDASCPDSHEVLPAPFDVALADDTIMQPDILVARRSDLTPRDLPTAPVLAVEVLSPSTSRIDRTLKKARFEAAGCPSSWVVDPLDPSLTAWELDSAGAYAEVVTVVGAETWTARLPYVVMVDPSALVR